MSHRTTVRVYDGKLGDIVCRQMKDRKVKVTVIPNGVHYKVDYYREYDVNTKEKLKFTPESLIYMLPCKRYPDGCFLDYEKGEWNTVVPDADGHVMVCQRLWDGNPLPDRKYPVHLPSIAIAIKYTIEREKLEKLLSGDDQPVSKRGRPKLYADSDEKKRKHREQALRSYYRRKALKEHLGEPTAASQMQSTLSAASQMRAANHVET